MSTLLNLPDPKPFDFASEPALSPEPNPPRPPPKPFVFAPNPPFEGPSAETSGLKTPRPNPLGAPPL